MLHGRTLKLHLQYLRDHSKYETSGGIFNIMVAMMISSGVSFFHRNIKILINLQQKGGRVKNEHLV